MRRTANAYNGRISGIERDVYLYSTPKVRIRDFFARADLDGDYADGTLRVEVDIRDHRLDGGGEYQVRMTLAELNDLTPIATDIQK